VVVVTGGVLFVRSGVSAVEELLMDDDDDGGCCCGCGQEEEELLSPLPLILSLEGRAAEEESQRQ